MAKVLLNKSLSKDDILWRYLSLDKLIHMLDTRSIFFTSLGIYANSDPYEGYVPRVVFETLASACSPVINDMDAYFENKIQNQNTNGLNYDELEEFRKLKDNKINDVRASLKDLYKKIIPCMFVNCWHRNNSESEAMWKLYSDQGKGVAIKTTARSLIRALEDCDESINLTLGAVKYLDFSDKNISASDCIIDGHFAPLLKRSSFSHENEVRLFNLRKEDFQNQNQIIPEPLLVRVNPSFLIEDIYISPYSVEPFIYSTSAICKKYGVAESNIHKSTLLNSCEDLLESLIIKA
jgi:hypothetical protein